MTRARVNLCVFSEKTAPGREPSGRVRLQRARPQGGPGLRLRLRLHPRVLQAEHGLPPVQPGPGHAHQEAQGKLDPKLRRKP